MENVIHAGMAGMFKYPGLFNLEYAKFYYFSIEGKEAAVLLNKCTKGVKTTDNNNTLEEIRNGSNPKQPERSRIVTMKPFFDEDDYEGRQIEDLNIHIKEYEDKEVFLIENYYSELIVFVEYKQFRVEHYTTDNSRYLKILSKALHKFITKYNLASGHNVIIDYISEEKLGSISYILRAGYFPIPEGRSFQKCISGIQVWGFEKQSLTIENVGFYGVKELKEVTIKEITSSLLSSLQNDLMQEEIFLSNAWQQLTLSNYKYSYLEAFFAIETSVAKFLLYRKKAAGIPENIVANFSIETSISHQINIEIPLALGSVDENHAHFIEALNKIRKTRNNIVHRGDDVTREEAEDALRVIMQYINFLNHHSNY